MKFDHSCSRTSYAITENIEIILKRAKDMHLEAQPRIISDKGPQFIAKEFKGFIRIAESASGRERRCRLKMGGVWRGATSSITTTSA